MFYEASDGKFQLQWLKKGSLAFLNEIKFQENFLDDFNNFS